MALEVLMFAVEVIYLWRAFPFCSAEAKQTLLDRLSMPLPAGAQPVHQAMRAWLRGGILNSLNNSIEAEKVFQGYHSLHWSISMVFLQSLNEALRFDGVIKNDKHILSFSLYELATIQISRNEV